MTNKRPERSVSTEQRESEDARDKAETSYQPRKRMRSPFGRFRDRSFSRERPAVVPGVEAECMPVRDRSEKQEDIDSNELHTTSNHGNRKSQMWLCSQLRQKRRKTI